jgi:hypothetical protein
MMLVAGEAESSTPWSKKIPKTREVQRIQLVISMKGEMWKCGTVMGMLIASAHYEAIAPGKVIQWKKERRNSHEFQQVNAGR